MKNLKNNLKNKLKNNKKGFTLVEIIVVLVILAILAAAAIPTMLGFVEDSKGKAEIANARAAYIACQSIATEEFSDGKPENNTLKSEETYKIAVDTTSAQNTTTNNKKLNQMLGADMANSSVAVTFDTVNTGKVATVVYVSDTTTKDAYKVTITADSSSVVEKITNP